MLGLVLTEFEVDPSGEHIYVSLNLEVRAAPFAGASSCTVLARDLDRFLDELEPLARTSKGTACLVGGWGEREDVQLALRPHGSLGHIELHVMLREHQPATDFRVEGSLIVEPQQLIDFTNAPRTALTSQEARRIELPSTG